MNLNVTATASIFDQEIKSMYINNSLPMYINNKVSLCLLIIKSLYVY